jgi:hypothetical protein
MRLRDARARRAHDQRLAQRRQRRAAMHHALMMILTEKQEALARLPARHDEAVAVKQHTEDVLRDLEIDLCNLAASFVTSPMSGRMFVPLSNEYVGEAAAQESRHAQMLGERR